MVEYLFFFLMFVIFFFRDIQLLTTGGALPLKIRLLAYSLIQLLLVIGLVMLCPQFHGARFADLLRSWIVWPISMALHCVAGLACYLARGRTYRHTWAIALLPNPILILSLVSVGHVFPNDRVWGDPCFLAALLWVSAVSAGVLLMSRQLRYGADFIFVVDFAAVSNMAMLVAISVALIAH